MRFIQVGIKMRLKNDELSGCQFTELIEHLDFVS